MEDREQNLALDENRKSNRTALIAALIIMMVIVGVVAAVVFFNPESEPSDTSSPVSDESISDGEQSHSALYHRAAAKNGLAYYQAGKADNDYARPSVYVCRVLILRDHRAGKRRQRV